METATLQANDGHAGGMSVEEANRAQIYTLLGNLFYAPPSNAMLQAIANSPDVGDEGRDTPLGRAWRELREAAAMAAAEEIRHEFDAAFIGTGRQPVMLYASFYLTGFLNEKPLAELREDLARIGLARRPDSHEPEDHIAGLADAMRYLIAGAGDTPPASLEAQHAFFRRYIEPCAAALCDAVAGAAETNFYKRVAAFARAFFAVEQQAFEMAG